MPRGGSRGRRGVLGTDVSADAGVGPGSGETAGGLRSFHVAPLRKQKSGKYFEIRGGDALPRGGRSRSVPARRRWHRSHGCSCWADSLRSRVAPCAFPNGTLKFGVPPPPQYHFSGGSWPGRYFFGLLEAGGGVWQGRTMALPLGAALEPGFPQGISGIGDPHGWVWLLGSVGAAIPKTARAPKVGWEGKALGKPRHRELDGRKRPPRRIRPVGIVWRLWSQTQTTADPYRGKITAGSFSDPGILLRSPGTGREPAARRPHAGHSTAAEAKKNSRGIVSISPKKSSFTPGIRAWRRVLK